MTELVRLRIRPSRDGKTFVYMFDYADENGKRRRISLGYADRRKAERQKLQKERELRIGIVAPESMRLSDFLEDSLDKTGSRIRESTQYERRSAMKHFIKVIGDIDYRRVTLKHGELFRQTCLDQGNSPVTVSKKLRQLKTLFELTVDRRQLDENPLKRIKLPKSSRKKVEVFAADECERTLKAACDSLIYTDLRWDLLIIAALTTGMRRGELLNSIWSDIDFQKQTIEVTPKKNTGQTWEWLIKDTDRRVLPLTEDVIVMLADHQSRQPENYPYVFIPRRRHDHIQRLRAKGEWNLSDSRLKVINNFSRQFGKILRRAGVRKLEFHDLRSTALTNWFANGMSEHDVMTLAGHSSFATTHEFYLAVADDLVDRARLASAHALGQNLAHIWHAPTFLEQRG